MYVFLDEQIHVDFMVEVAIEYLKCSLDVDWIHTSVFLLIDWSKCKVSLIGWCRWTLTSPSHAHLKSVTWDYVICLCLDKAQTVQKPSSIIIETIIIVSHTCRENISSMQGGWKCLYDIKIRLHFSYKWLKPVVM